MKPGFLNTRNIQFDGNILARIDENSLRESLPIYYIYAAYKYIFFTAFVGFTTALVTVLAVVAALFASEKTVNYFAVAWARINSFFTPISVRVIGKEKTDKKQSYVIVANHQSQYDIFVVYGWMPVSFRWVMKAELRKVPFLGYYCYKAGHVYIDRSDGKAARKSINEAKDRIKDGTSILFFPEGHRSDDGKLIDFKKGAFKLAIDMGLPVLPVSIIGTMDILPARTLALFPGKAKMVIHDPIQVDGYNDDNISELIEKSRRAIQQGMDEYSCEK